MPLETTGARTAAMPTTPAPALRWQDGAMWRRGREHRMLSGALHYFRVHPDQWEDRLRRLAAMGANTVDTYVPWNFHERTEGDIRFYGWRDLGAFLRLCSDLEFDVLIRPSPYICAEWSNGGLPHWLTGRVAAVRTSDPAFLAAVDRWYDELIPLIAAHQAAHGGPVVAVQVENEYGSYGSDAAYPLYLTEALRARGIVELLTTADGTMSDMIAHGSVEGALTTFTFGTGVAVAQELTPAGMPTVCSELWGGWFDHWGEPHHVRSADSMIATVDELLDAGGSVSLYMAHGGTNFGLWAGANHDGALQPTVTSYDSDAPIGEDGTLGDKFAAVRASFARFSDGALPPVPPPPTYLAPQTVELRPTASVYEVIQSCEVLAETPSPQTFEQLGVEDGLVAYTAVSLVPKDEVLAVDGLHDRATVFVDGTRVATLDRDGTTTVRLAGSDRPVEITVLVESLGRINYGPRLGEHKGILEGVRIGRRLVHGWRHRALPLDNRPQVAAPAAGGADGVAVATVNVAAPADAWLAFPDSAKGMVWLNGFLLGRYWSVGPVRTMYAPAPLWRAGDNEICVLDTDALGTTLEIRDQPDFGPRQEFIGS